METVSDDSVALCSKQKFVIAFKRLMQVQLNFSCCVRSRWHTAKQKFHFDFIESSNWEKKLFTCRLYISIYLSFNKALSSLLFAVSFLLDGNTDKLFQLQRLYINYSFTCLEAASGSLSVFPLDILR